MEKIDLKRYLYHGIVDWLYHDIERPRLSFCLNKLDSILKSRYISRPCDFERFGVNHSDCMNNDTYHYTFVACHPESSYASRFHKKIIWKCCYLLATKDSCFGIILSPRLIDELPIEEDSFYDSEIVIADNISIDQYGVGIYVNPALITEDVFQEIKTMINQNQYAFPIINIQNGEVIESIKKEKTRILSNVRNK